MNTYIQQLEDLGFEEDPYGFAQGGEVMQDFDPQQLQQFSDALQPEIENIDVTPEDADMLQQVFAYLIKNKENYAGIRKELIKEGVVDSEDLPEKYDARTLGAMLLVFNQLKAAKSPAENDAQIPQQFSYGGEVNPYDYLAAQGRNGDTMLAHVTPEEAGLLQALGGSGTINPETGLPEYFKKLVKKATKAVGSVVKAVGNVAKEVVSSPIGKIAATVALGAVLGPAGLGLSSTLAGAGAGAIVGGASAAANGDNILKGAITGGALGAVGGATFQGMGGIDGIGQTYAQEGIGGLLKSAGSNLISSPGTIAKEFSGALGLQTATGATPGGVPTTGAAAGSPFGSVAEPTFIDSLVSGAGKVGSAVVDYAVANPGKVATIAGMTALGALDKQKPSGGGVAYAPKGPPPALTRTIEQGKYGPIAKFAAHGGIMHAYANGGQVRPAYAAGQPLVMQDGGFVMTGDAVQGARDDYGDIRNIVPEAQMISAPGGPTDDLGATKIVGKNTTTPARVSNGEAYIPPGYETEDLYALMRELEESRRSV